MHFSSRCLVLAFFFLSVSLVSCDYGDFVISSATRGVDLDSQFARHLTNITLENVGSSDSNTFYVAIHEEKVPNLSLLLVRDFRTNEDFRIYSAPVESSEKRAIYKVEVKESIPAGKSADFAIYSVYTHTMKPLPASIRQGERQLVKYEDHAHVFSPYQIKTQTTNYKLPSATVESFQEKAPTAHREQLLAYGPYNDVPPFSRAKIHIHFENNKPFVTITKIQRDIEISHWGNIAVEETLNFQHDGAIHKGPWSRWDYHRMTYQQLPVPAVASLVEILPADASDIYYRDEIGNISTSQYAVAPEGVSFNFKPRFPLFGGWKTSHYHGYNLPLGNHLFQDYNNPSTHVLNFTVAPRILDAVIDHLVVRVILPEGATDIKLHAPFAVENERQTLHWTYLDTAGRPVLIFEKRNLVIEHNEHFQVTYSFSGSSMYHEPFLLIAGYFSLLFLVIIYVRLDFGVNAKGSETESISDSLLRFKEEVFDIYQNAFAALDASAQKRDEKTYKADKAQQQRKIDQADNAFREIQQDLQHASAPQAGKVADLKKALDDKLQQQAGLHQSEISGKGPSGKEKGSLEVLEDKIDGLFADLFEREQ